MLSIFVWHHCRLSVSYLICWPPPPPRLEFHLCCVRWQGRRPARQAAARQGRQVGWLLPPLDFSQPSGAKIARRICSRTQYNTDSLAQTSPSPPRTAPRNGGYFTIWSFLVPIPIENYYHKNATSIQNVPSSHNIHPYIYIYTCSIIEVQEEGKKISLFEKCKFFQPSDHWYRSDECQIKSGGIITTWLTSIFLSYIYLSTI